MTSYKLLCTLYIMSDRPTMITVKVYSLRRLSRQLHTVCFCLFVQYGRVFDVLSRYYHTVNPKPDLDMFAARVYERLGAMKPAIKYGAVQEVGYLCTIKSMSTKQLFNPFSKTNHCNQTDMSNHYCNNVTVYAMLCNIFLLLTTEVYFSVKSKSQSTLNRFVTCMQLPALFT